MKIKSFSKRSTFPLSWAYVFFDCSLRSRSKILWHEKMFQKYFDGFYSGYLYILKNIYNLLARPFLNCFHQSQSFLWKNTVEEVHPIYEIIKLKNKHIEVIDGTRWFIFKPSSGLQWCCYSGQKRCHCLLFLTVVMPNGMNLFTYRQFEGRRHDMFSYAQNEADNKSCSILHINDKQYRIYRKVEFAAKSNLPHKHQSANKNALESSLWQ